MSGESEIVLIVIAICSYYSVKVWVNARRDEREAFYRSEAIKKIAEMQGTVPEAVLQVLKEAMTPKPEPPSVSYDYNKEREAFYRSETAKKIAETGGAAAAVDYLRHQELRADLQFIGGMKLWGTITIAAGIGLMIFLRAVNPTAGFYLMGLIPVLVGLVLLVYGFSIKTRN